MKIRPELLAVLLALAGPVLGQKTDPAGDPDPEAGSGYRGPGDTGPGSASDKPASTPSSAAPDATPAGDSASGSSVSTGPVTGLPPGAGATDPAADSRSDTSSWTSWWDLRQDIYLDLKRRMYHDPLETGGDGFFLGRSDNAAPLPNGSRPNDAQIRERIVPALLDLLEQEPSNEVRISALIALARIGAERAGAGRTEFEQVLVPFLRDANQNVSEATAAALGILGNDGSALILSELVLDTELGRKAAGRREVHPRLRAFAAYGMALISARAQNEDVRRYVVHKLVRALETDRTSSSDLPVACVLALACSPLPWSGTIERQPVRGAPRVTSREGQLLYLLEIIDDRERDRLVRAQAAIALGALAAAVPAKQVPETVAELQERVGDELLARLDPRGDQPTEVRQGSAMGLGWVAASASGDLDRSIRGALAAPEDDQRVRHWAFVALAQAAARPERVAAARSVLLRALERTDETARWAALSLGLLEREVALSGEAVSAEVQSALRERLADTSSSLQVGAFAIACGLLEDREAELVLRDKLRGMGDDRARGYVAIALGLIGARASAGELQRVVYESTFRPDLLRDSATALGLLGDHDVLRVLAEQLKRAGSLASQSSVGQALGRIGDASSIDPLLAMLADRDRAILARAQAAAALGSIADKDDLPWHTLLAPYANLYAAPPTLFDPDGSGILDLSQTP